MKNEKKREALTWEELREKAAAYASKVVGKEFKLEITCGTLITSDDSATAEEKLMADIAYFAYLVGAKRVMREMKRMNIADVVGTLLKVGR